MITIKYKCGHTEETNCYDCENEKTITNLLNYMQENRICLSCYIEENKLPLELNIERVGDIQ